MAAMAAAHRARPFVVRRFSERTFADDMFAEWAMMDRIEARQDVQRLVDRVNRGDVFEASGVGATISVPAGYESCGSSLCDRDHSK